MKKIPVWLVVILILALLLAAKFLFFPKKTEQKPGGTAGKGVPVAVNYFVTGKSELNNNVFTTGKMGAFNEVEILPEVNGKISSINFEEGETVAKGKLLVKLNDADLQAQLLKNRTQLKLSQQKLERLKKLLNVNGISQEEFEMQENEVLALQADESFVLAQIAKTNIVAPFSGVAGLRNVSEGAFVNASTPIVSLVQLRPLFIEFSVPEKYSMIFKKGSDITFSSDEISSVFTHSATIYAIDPRVDETTKTIRARARYNGERAFLPGSFVKVQVNLGETENAIMVPTQAVIGTLKGQKVFVSRGGKAGEVQVKIGVRTDKSIQITEGLGVGDTVLTTGLLSLKKDSPVKLIKQQN